MNQNHYRFAGLIQIGNELEVVTGHFATREQAAAAAFAVCSPASEIWTAYGENVNLGSRAHQRGEAR